MDAQCEKLQESFNKDLENIKNNQTELKNTITETKNTPEGINSSRINESEEQISELEDRMGEINTTEQNKEKRMKNENSLRDLWDNIKHTNIRIIGT